MLTTRISRTAQILAFVLLAVVPGSRGYAAVSLDEIRELRKEAAQRERRIVFDNDGNEPVYYMDEATPEALLAARTAPLAGSQVDTIVYCTWSSGFGYFTHNTKVGTVFDSVAEEPGKGPGSGFSKNTTRALIDQGTDPLRVVVDWCRAHDVEVFWSMRMNDVHDAWNAWYSPHLFPPIKQEHPEWLMGTKDERPVNGAWSSVDYGVPEIRDYAFRFIEEVCTNYDIDGVQMDFFRHLSYFKKSAWGEECGPEEWAMMTDFVRRVRQMADEVGTARGKPILISVRVPDSVDLCKAFGLDIETWMREGLIDILTVSCYFRVNPWETSVRLGHTYGVQVWPSLSESRIRDDAARQLRGGIECYRARAMEAWHSGADAIYMFNFFNPNSRLWWELGSPETMQRLDKTYVTAARGLGNLSFYSKEGEKYFNRSIVTPDSPRTIAPGGAETAELIVGDTLPIENAPKATLRLRFAHAEDAARVAVSINGTPLTDGEAQDAYINMNVPVEALVTGVNRLEFQAAEGADPAPTLVDLMLLLDYPEQETGP